MDLFILIGEMTHCRIVVETGMHSPWASRVLSGSGHEVIAAHGRNVRLIRESRKKDDRMDAQTLARRFRLRADDMTDHQPKMFWFKN